MEMSNSENDKIIVRSEAEQKRAIVMHDSFRDELLKRQLSNSENYDKAILTLSSAGLAFSIGVLRFLVPVGEAQSLWLVKTSWICFLFSVILSLVAYRVSNAAIDKQLKIAEDHYINKLAGAFKEATWISRINNFLNYIVGLLFIVAITAMVIFVIINLKQKECVMSDKTTKIQPQKIQIKESAIVPKMQITPDNCGVNISSAPVPTMQAAPETISPSQSQPTQEPSQQPQSQLPKNDSE